MPHVLFKKTHFLKAIQEEEYGDKDIENIFAKLGMEAEVVEDEDKELCVKLEFSANRYDLSGMEGAVIEVRSFLGKDKPIIIKPAPPTIKFFIENPPPSRLYAVGAVFRGVKFTPEIYLRFIALQEKLHENACRRRTLVAIGTHDLDSIKPPFYYRGEDPNVCKFIPLLTTLTNGADVPIPPEDQRAFIANDLYDYYDKNHLPLGKYTDLLRGLSSVAVIRDSNGVVLSHPPLVNGEHSKCSAGMKNIFFDVTGTDLNRVTVMLNVLVSLFAQYCDVVESVEVVVDGVSHIYPKIAPLEMDVQMEQINSLLGLSLSPEETCVLLEKKQISAVPLPSAPTPSIHCTIPAHRSDVMHAFDVAEDVMIVYDINRIPPITPSYSVTGATLLAEDATEGIRQIGANNGYVEMYNFVLLSLQDGFRNLLRPTCAGRCGGPNLMIASSATNPFISSSVSSSSPSSSSSSSSSSLCRCGIVSTLNGKSPETEVVRLSLIPCLLKSLRKNNSHPRPICLFEVGDVVIPDYQGCAYAFIPLPNGEKPACEGVCGGGCIVAPSFLNILNSSSSTLPLAPSPFVPPLFEYPNSMGVLKSDSGCRNERHFAAVRCGPDVVPEQLIPLIARLFNNFRVVFGGGEVDRDSLPLYWELLHIPSFVNLPSSRTSSFIRWVADSSSFINNNFTLIAVTFKKSSLPFDRIPIGIMGVLRPDVVKNAVIHTNIVAFEINLEPLYDLLL